ncbi:MAG: leucyl/phenylalanyl-tRNA---protein transferase [Actinomycetota bacterium]|nr:leucyl/phenylalanyl-tRNA---protein transferase [Actinomycetota bacterium]
MGIGADLTPGTVLSAYRSGMFPMPIGPVREVIAWWSPDPRGVLPLEALRVTRSLRASCQRYDVRVDTAFDAVIDACAAPDRTGRWINEQVRDAYVELHRLGWAHSVEAWSADGALAGGLYGVAIGGLFAGESMFHHQRDASKVALVTHVTAMRGSDDRMLDVQWVTPHLASLGAVDIPRREYLARLSRALRAPLPSIFEET